MNNIQNSDPSVAAAVIDFNNYAAQQIMAIPVFTSLYNTYSDSLKIVPQGVPHIICGKSGIDIINDPIKWLSSQTGEPTQQIISLIGFRLFMTKGTGDLLNTRVQYSAAYYLYLK
jgi:general stress protein CsbA